MDNKEEQNITKEFISKIKSDSKLDMKELLNLAKSFDKENNFNNSNEEKNEIKIENTQSEDLDLKNLQLKLDGKLPVDRDELLALVNSWGRIENFYTFDKNGNEIKIEKQDAKEKYDLSKLDVSEIKDFDDIFKYSNFNSDINSWDVSNGTSMDFMFDYTKEFNSPLDKWNTSNVTSMYCMFSYAEKFNQNINSLDVSNVKDMKSMFAQTEVFNQPLDKWNTSNVTSMHRMFYGAKKFNQDLNSWDISKVINMDSLFEYAKDFNSSLDQWDISNVSTCNNMFNFATAFKEKYDKTKVLSNDTTFIKTFFKINIMKDLKIDFSNKNEVVELSSLFKSFKLSLTNIGFNNIIGMNDIKKQLKDLIVVYKTSNKILEKYKIERDKGFILYGEPGTGKTMLCKAFAKELDSAFIYVSMEQFLDRKNSNVSIKILFDEIEILSNKLINKNIVLFLDELDSLRARGSSGLNNSYFDGFTNEMLYRIDNLPKNVIIVGATNNIDNIDEAVTRAGRLGNKYEVKCNFKKTDIEKYIINHFKQIDMKEIIPYAKDIASLIFNLNGAEVSNILNKIKSSYFFRKKNCDLKKLIIATIHQTKYQITILSHEDKDLKTIAFHEAGHAFANIYFYGTKYLNEINIYNTKNSLGYVSSTFDEKIKTKKDIEQFIIICLAGRYSEKLVSNDLSIGASGDLKRVNSLIKSMIYNYGFSDNLENFNIENLLEASDYLKEQVDKEAHLILKDLTNKTKLLINENKDIIEMIAKDLIKEKVLINCFEKYNKKIKSKKNS